MNTQTTYLLYSLIVNNSNPRAEFILAHRQRTTSIYFAVGMEFLDFTHIHWWE